MLRKPFIGEELNRVLLGDEGFVEERGSPREEHHPTIAQVPMHERLHVQKGCRRECGQG